MNRLLLVLTLLLFCSISYAQEIEVRGKLARTVESGGWLIVQEDKKYLILNYDKYSKESWFKEGAEVRAKGQIKTDTVSIFMEGTPFEASEIKVKKSSKKKQAGFLSLGGYNQGSPLLSRN
jgi:hypothetical protein